MGGWNIFYALINFAILAAALYFIGKKLVITKYREHRDSVAQALKGAEDASEKAERLKMDAALAKEDGQRVCREILAEAQSQAEQTRTETEALDEGFKCRQQEELEAERQQLLADRRRSMTRSAADKLAASAAELARSRDMSGMERSFIEKLPSAIRLSKSELERIAAEGELHAVLTAARPLDDGIVAELEEIIARALSNAGAGLEADDVHLAVDTEPEMIGGMSLRIGDTVFDGTVAGMLERAKKSIAGTEQLQDELVTGIEKALSRVDNSLDVYQTGAVTSASDGICRVSGLSGAMAGEMLLLESGLMGMVMDLEPDNIGVVLLGDYDGVHEGDKVRCTGRIIEVPVGEELIGRVVDALGRPLDGKGAVSTGQTRPVESPAPGVIQREPVSVPLQTGIKAIDALIPIGRGQRELIIGDRQTGKTAIALDAIINQKGKDVICIYVAVGQKESTVAGVVEKLRAHGAMEYTTVVCASASSPAPMLYIAPYAGAAMGEYFMYKGRDVLVVYDDLSKQAVAYREISLLLHRPPGREAYPGDVFYLHSRLLERAARLSPEAGGGSMTALPIIETQAGDIAAYIPTNDISITDGQIFLETDLFNSGVRPAVNVGLSVSRVGGAAQLGAVKQVSGRLRMELAQYRELAAFSQFGLDLDKATQETLNRGDRMTELLKQGQYAPMSAVNQVIAITAVSEGYADDVPVGRILDYEAELLPYVNARWPELESIVNSGAKLNREQLLRLRQLTEDFSKSFR